MPGLQNLLLSRFYWASRCAFVESRAEGVQRGIGLPVVICCFCFCGGVSRVVGLRVNDQGIKCKLRAECQVTAADGTRSNTANTISLAIRVRGRGSGIYLCRLHVRKAQQSCMTTGVAWARLARCFKFLVVICLRAATLFPLWAGHWWI